MVTKKKTKRAAPTVRRRPVPADDRALVTSVIGELQQHLEIIAKRRAELAPGSFDQDLAGAAASLGKVLLTGAAERRQQRKHTYRELAAIPLEAIIGYLRTLPEDERQQIALDVSGASDEDPLL
jgi:hypothetical protein